MEGVLLPDDELFTDQDGGRNNKKLYKEEYFHLVRNMFLNKGFIIRDSDIKHSWKNYNNIWKSWTNTQKDVNDLYKFILKEPSWKTLEYELDPYGKLGKSMKNINIKKKSKTLKRIHRVKKSELKMKLNKKRENRDREKKIFNFSLTRNRRKIKNVNFFTLTRHGFLYISWLQGQVYFNIDDSNVKGLTFSDMNMSLSFRYSGSNTPIDIIPHKYKVVFNNSKDYQVIKNMII